MFIIYKPVTITRRNSVAAGRNGWLHAFRLDSLDERITVMTLVAEQSPPRLLADCNKTPAWPMPLAPSQREIQWVAKGSVNGAKTYTLLI